MHLASIIQVVTLFLFSEYKPHQTYYGTRFTQKDRLTESIILKCLCLCVPEFCRRGFVTVCKRGRCLAVAKGGFVLAWCRKGLYLCLWTGGQTLKRFVMPFWICVYVWQSLKGCFQDILRWCGDLFPQDTKKLQLSNNNIAYTRVPENEEDSYRVNTELITLRERLRDEERDKNNALKRVEDLTQRLRASDQAKNDALSRLSEHVALKLADNNPNIVDLSDVNRPTNLAEKFSTLYDDEWTDAFDALTQTSEFAQESKAIQCLLDIVQECFKLCRQESDQQLQQLLAPYGLTLDHAPRELLKMTKDTRKKHASMYLPVLYQTILKQFSASHGDIMQDEAVEEYIKRCIDICWLMTVQDPPMALSSEVGPDKRYNKNKHRIYTQSGPYIEYVVWPCVLIQDGGCLMSKGVAQCCNNPGNETIITIN